MILRFINTYEPVNSIYRDLLPYLCNKGLNIEVLISCKQYKPGRIPIWKSIRNNSITFQTIRGLGNRNPKNTLQKAMNSIAYICGVIAKTILKKGAYVNVFLTQPPLFYIYGYLLKIIKNQRYVCIIMDLYPDVLIANGNLQPRGIITKILSKLSKHALEHAEAIIVIGRCQKQLLENKGIEVAKIHTIPNWADETNLRFEQKLSDSSPESEKMVVMYSGNMGTCHTFDEMIAAAEKLKTQPNIRFMLIGEGVRKGEIKKSIDLFGLNNCQLMSYVPEEELTQSLMSADVHLITLEKGFDGLVVPSKAYNIMALGKPIIYVGSNNGEIARLIQESNCGVVVEPKDNDRMVKTIMAYLANPELKELHGHNGKTYYSHHCAMATELSKYHDVLKSVMREGDNWNHN